MDVGPRPVLELGVHVLGGEQPWAVEEVSQNSAAADPPVLVVDEEVLGSNSGDVGLVREWIGAEDGQIGVEQDRGRVDRVGVDRLVGGAGEWRRSPMCRRWRGSAR